MQHTNIIDLTRAVVQNIMPYSNGGPAVDVLRIDEVHPIISGNKYFKLLYYIDEAIRKGSDGFITYGGPWSNHIVAVAEVAKSLQLASVGYIRGEEPALWSAALKDAASAHMDVRFLSRSDFNERKDGQINQYDQRWTIIPEGGAGPSGIRGAATMLELFDPKSYDAIACAVGSGTMMAGMLSSVPDTTQVIGVSVLKGEDSFTSQFSESYGSARFKIVSGYHFGGYGKWTADLITFINKFYDTYGIGLDFVYTGKLFYAISEMLARGEFSHCRRLLIIHSGGLQGNRSLPGGTFHFG